MKKKMDRINRENRSHLRARAIMEKIHGYAAIEGKIVHHVDGNPLNNNIENLRIMTWAKHSSVHHAKDPNIKLRTVYCRLPHSMWVSIRKLQEERKVKSITDAVTEALKEFIEDCSISGLT